MYSEQYNACPSPDGGTWDQLHEQALAKNQLKWITKTERS